MSASRDAIDVLDAIDAIDAVDDTAESGNPVEPHSSAHGSASVSRMSIPAAPIDVPNAQCPQHSGKDGSQQGNADCHIKRLHDVGAFKQLHIPAQGKTFPFSAADARVERLEDQHGDGYI